MRDRIPEIVGALALFALFALFPVAVMAPEATGRFVMIVVLGIGAGVALYVVGVIGALMGRVAFDGCVAAIRKARGDSQ